MKKAILLSLLFVACVFTASAQKFALIDMEYILKNIPAYEQANTQLNQASQQYQSEADTRQSWPARAFKTYIPSRSPGPLFCMATTATNLISPNRCCNDRLWSSTSVHPPLTMPTLLTAGSEMWASSARYCWAVDCWTN